jgi:hypothetical protein
MNLELCDFIQKLCDFGKFLVLSVPVLFISQVRTVIEATSDGVF